jgi:adenine C2-methylase RlmN of 23S rRNA A2503 and tRNA A37
VPATVRLTRGRDIEAACGQLAAAPKAPGRRAPAPAV